MRKRKVTRRSFVATVVGGTAAGSLGLIVPGEAKAQGCSDTDSGYGADPGGRGRRCSGQAYTGCSDRDPTDPGMRGRNCGNQPRACTDVDGGANADPAGRGRSCGAARTATACNQCNCPEYVPSGDRLSRCQRCGHRVTEHGGD